MSDNRRAATILSQVGLTPPTPVSVLPRAVLSDFPDSQLDVASAAQELLVEQRIKEPHYRHPSKKKRHIFMTAEQKRKAYDHNNWTFRKHDVAKAFDELLHRSPLVRPGIAQALLAKAGDCSVETLWAHFQDPTLEEKLKRGNNAATLATRSIKWLDDVTYQGSMDYIVLLASSGPGQDALDRAFSIALSKGAVEVMRVLLSFGACAYGAKLAIQAQIKLGNIALVRLLLSAPAAMDPGTWAWCMAPAIQAAMSGRADSRAATQLIMLLYFAHRNYPNYTNALFNAIESEDPQSAAIVLAYGGTELQEENTQHRAFELATGIQNSEGRHTFLALLLSAGMSNAGLLLANELLKDVEGRHVALVKLLIQAGVHPDIEPYHSIRSAVSAPDFEMLDVLRTGKLSSSCRDVIKSAPVSASESVMVRLVHILGCICQVTDCEAFGSELIYAVQKQWTELVNALLRFGASVRVEEVAAIRAALKSDRLDLLERLLAAPCSPTELRLAIPTALAMKSRSLRLEAMSAILNKGIEPRALDVPLQSLAAEIKNPDLALIRLLLQYRASVSYRDDNGGNCVLDAARRGDLSLLEVLCDAWPSAEILADAVYCAFSLLQARDDVLVMNIMTLLLQKGAVGEPVDQTLVRATVGDAPIDIVKALLEAGANANCSKGACYINALKSKNDDLIKLLCGRCNLTRESLESIYPVILNPRSYSKEYLDLVLASSQHCPMVLDAMWDLNKIRAHTHRIEILSCFLYHGMDVNVGHGSVVSLAVQIADLHLLSHVLTAMPSLESLRTGFEEVASIANNDTRHEIMRLLLESSLSAEIGQSRLVPQETATAITTNHQGLQLLLHHRARVDSVSVTICVESKNLMVLDMLLKQRVASEILQVPFQRARTLDCDEKTRIRLYKRLLDAGHRSSEVSKALVETVNRYPDRIELPKLLLEHGAAVNYEEGGAVRSAAVSGCLETLDLLLAYNPTQATMEKALMPVQLSELHLETKHRVLERLLARSVSPEVASEVLIKAVAMHPAWIQTIHLLLQHGARVGFQDAEPLQFAILASPRDVFELLAAAISEKETAELTFSRARNAPMSPEKRDWVYGSLLPHGVSTHEASEALVHLMTVTPSRIQTIKLLLGHGAEVRHHNGSAITQAIFSKCVESVKLLSEHIKDQETADLAFDFARTAKLDPELRYTVYRSLLKRSVNQGLKYQALKGALLQADSDFLPIINLLLDAGADPNQELGVCFVWAAQNAAEAEFRALCKKANPSIVLHQLLQTFQEEQDVAKWSRICLDSLHDRESVSGDVSLLFEAMEKFPLGTELIDLLLKHGASAAARAEYALCEGWQTEACTALVWALFHRSVRVGNEVILKLIRQEDSVPEYTTPLSNISAVFGCLFDVQRTVVLNALLNRKNNIISCTKPLTISVLANLAQCPAKLQEELVSVDITPMMGAIILGNQEAFHLLQRKTVPDDGSLHLAALLARPDFISLLLEVDHDPNYRSLAFDYKLPLAVACCSNREVLPQNSSLTAHWPSSLKKAMQLLSAKTDTRWRSKEDKSVLHFALESSLEATQALVDVLNVRNDPQKDEKYLFREPETKIWHSPTKYVERFVHTHDHLVERLVACLKAQGLKDRLFREVKPRIGTQPLGYEGLPSELDVLWQEFEDEERLASFIRDKEGQERAQLNAQEDEDRARRIAQEDEDRAREEELENSERARRMELEDQDRARRIAQEEEDRVRDEALETRERERKKALEDEERAREEALEERDRAKRIEQEDQDAARRRELEDEETKRQHAREDEETNRKLQHEERLMAQEWKLHQQEMVLRRETDEQTFAATQRKNQSDLEHMEKKARVLLNAKREMADAEQAHFSKKLSLEQKRLKMLKSFSSGGSSSAQQLALDWHGSLEEPD